MICRGFSLRILTDIYLTQDINQENLKYRYANGKGLDWLLEKRIDSIKKIKLIEVKDNIMSLKYPQGFILSKITMIFYKLFLINKGGI